jgi:hypothetical protein
MQRQDARRLLVQGEGMTINEPRTQAGCIETDWARDGKGYGLKYLHGRNLRAHRWAWELAHGPIPDGMLVCHTCDNPPCVNVAHLFLRHGRSARQHGVSNGRAKLTEADVYAIRNRHAAGESASDIASAYGMNPTTIRRIVSGRYWSHV